MLWYNIPIKFTGREEGRGRGAVRLTVRIKTKKPKGLWSCLSASRAAGWGCTIDLVDGLSSSPSDKKNKTKTNRPCSVPGFHTRCSFVMWGALGFTSMRFPGPQSGCRAATSTGQRRNRREGRGGTERTPPSNWGQVLCRFSGWKTSLCIQKTKLCPTLVHFWSQWF